jgi:cell division protein FtsB
VFAALKPYIPTALLGFLIFYFGVHALTGDRGLLTGQTREETLTVRTRELEKMRAERIELETRVKLLSNRSLSRDLLEERARAMLGFGDPRDYVIRINR